MKENDRLITSNVLNKGDSFPISVLDSCFTQNRQVFSNYTAGFFFLPVLRIDLFVYYAVWPVFLKLNSGFTGFID